MIKCSACGRTLSYNRVFNKNKNHSFFQCSGYSKKLCSVSHGISEQKIVSAVLDSLQEAIGTDMEFERNKIAGKKGLQKDTDNLISIQLGKLKRKEERICTAYTEGVDTLEEYKRKKQQLLEEKRKLEEQKDWRRGENLENECFEKISDIRELFTSEYFSNAEKNRAICTIIEKIVYDKTEKTIFVYYRCL